MAGAAPSCAALADLLTRPRARPWFIAALVSWGVALAEYLLQVAANRIGYTTMNPGQLQILQEVVALSVFVPFAVLSMKQPLLTDEK